MFGPSDVPRGTYTVKKHNIGAARPEAASAPKAGETAQASELHQAGPLIDGKPAANAAELAGASQQAQADEGPQDAVSAAAREVLKLRAPHLYAELEAETKPRLKTDVARENVRPLPPPSEAVVRIAIARMNRAAEVVNDAMAAGTIKADPRLVAIFRTQLEIASAMLHKAMGAF
jgi:hypothetical protein